MVLLCDGGLAINLLSSVVMNGVCCLHNLSAEEERNREQQKELRRTINVEYERQRLFDKECRDRMRREEQLLAEKQRLAEQEKESYPYRQRGDVMLLCDVPSMSNDNNAQHDTNTHNIDLVTSQFRFQTSSQSSQCPRRTLMAKKLQLSSPSSSGAAVSLSPGEASTNLPGYVHMGHSRTTPRMSRNLSVSDGRRKRAHRTGWSDMMHHHRWSRCRQQRDDMSSSCASSTISLFDESDDEAE